MAGAKQYRYMGHHATELEVGETRPWVGPGDLIELDALDVNLQAMLDEGTLVDVEALTQEAEKAEKEAQKQAVEAARAEEAAAQEGAKEAEGSVATTTEEKKGGK